MEEVYVVRHRHLVEHVPIRRLSREVGIPRNTIRRYLRGAEPGVGKPRGIAGHPVRRKQEVFVPLVYRAGNLAEVGSKQAARLFAQVLRGIEARGVLVVADEVRAALASGEPIQLAVRTKQVASTDVPTDALPASLARVDVAAGATVDYVAWLGGVQ